MIKKEEQLSSTSDHPPFWAGALSALFRFFIPISNAKIMVLRNIKLITAEKKFTMYNSNYQ